MTELEQMKKEIQKLRHQLKEKDARQISLAEDLECDDTTCADILHETGNVLFGNSDGCRACFVWDKNTKLWVCYKTLPEIKYNISDILSNEMIKRFVTYQELVGAKAKSRYLDNIRKLKNDNKLGNIIRVAGRKQVSELDFNRKIYQEYVYPIKGGCLDLKTGLIRERTKEDRFTYELDYEIVQDTSDAEKLMRSFMPDNDEATYNYFLDASCIMISSFDFFKKMFNLVGEGNNGKSVYAKLMMNLAGRLGATLSEDIVRCGKNLVQDTIQHT